MNRFERIIIAFCLSVTFSSPIYSFEEQPKSICPQVLEKLSKSFEISSLPIWNKNTSERKAAVKAWEAKILELAESHWKRIGVDYERIPYRDGEALRVLPSNNSPINSLSKEVNDIEGGANNGVSLVFSPSSLLKEERAKEGVVWGLKNASFSSAKKVVNLPYTVIAEGKKTDSVHHEILHAVFEHYREKGIDSLFHTVFKATDKDLGMWKRTSYNKRMNYEELATMALNVRLAALRLSEALRTGDLARVRTTFEADYQVTARKLTTEIENAKRAQITTGHFIRRLLDKDHPLPLQVTTDDSGNHIVELEWRSILCSMTFVKGVGDPRAWNLSRNQAQSEERDSTRRKLISDRLKQQKDVAEVIYTEAELALKKLREMKTKYSERQEVSKDEIQELIELLNAPRKTSLKFIRL